MTVQLKHFLLICIVLALLSCHSPGVNGGRNARANDRRNTRVIYGRNTKVFGRPRSSFPKTLNGLGYAFNNVGQLRKVVQGTITNIPFQFEISSDRRINQAHYDALVEAVTKHVYQMLQNIGLRKIYVPSRGQSSFVFGTKTNFANTKKLLIIIHGSGKVRAGEWATSLIINDSINSGTQIQYIQRAIAEGFDVLVTNTNDNYRIVNGQRVRLQGSGSPEEHIRTVWQELIAPVYNSIQTFGIVAHSYGGVVTFQMAKDHPQAFFNKCFGVAFTDSVHRENVLSRSMSNWFHKNARNFVKSSKPLNTDLRSGPYGVPRFSSGHTIHKWTSWAAYNAVFPYLNSKYVQFLNRQNNRRAPS